jgi:hypothetical protein
MGTIPAKSLAPVAAEKIGHTRINNGAEKMWMIFRESSDSKTPFFANFVIVLTNP